MKKLYVLAGAFLMATGAFAQGHDLFFSGYNEGAHATGSIPPGGGTPSQANERAIQIFNPTTSTIDLSQYSIARFSNGATTPFQEEKLVRNQPNATQPNTLQPGDVFVYGNNQATLTDIVNNWDQQAAPYGPVTGGTVITQGGAAYFDGNDAIVLHRWTGGAAGVGTPVIVDIIGVIGENPAGGAWFSNTPTFPQDVSTKNMSLRRKGNIENGTKINPNPATYQIGDEWEVHSAWDPAAPTPGSWFAQSYTNLAGHAAAFNAGGGQYGTYMPLSTLKEFDSAITIYPNPVSNSKALTIKIENKKVASIVIINGLGQFVKEVPANFVNNRIKVETSSMKAGIYFIQIIANDEYKTKLFKKIVVQ